MVKLSVESNGSLRPTDFFSPGDADRMTAADHDFGSGGPILLPFGTKDYPHLFVTADKEAVLYLLNESSLGGRSSSATGSTAVYTSSPSLVRDPSTSGGVLHGLWGHMAAFAGAGRTGPVDFIYYEGTGWGGTDNMYVLNFDATNPAKPVLENIGATSQTFGFSSGSPVITSSGAAPASAIVWEVHADSDTGAGGSLDAFYALPRQGRPAGATVPSDRRRVPVLGPGDQRRPCLRGRQERRHRGYDGKPCRRLPHRLPVGQLHPYRQRVRR